MKKIAIILMALVLMVTSVLPVFAAGNFVSSPTYTGAPQLLDAQFSGDCEGMMVIVPFSKADTLDEDDNKKMNEAYQQIKDSKDLSKLFDGLKLPEGMKKFVVGDLFNVSFTDCDDHSGHKNFTFTLQPTTLKNFVGVMVFVNGEWIAVDAKVDGKNVIVNSEYYGPYTIVLGEYDSPQTGDSFPWTYVVLMAVSAAGLVAVLVALKKKA